MKIKKRLYRFFGIYSSDIGQGPVTFQARRQDSVTGGAEINFGGHEKFIYVNSRGAREVLFECG